MKKDYTEDFLMEFRKMEQLLQKIYGPNTTFRDVELRLSDDGDPEVDKMYVCRVLRNYASHNSDMKELCPIPQEAVDYLKRLHTKFENKIVTVGDKVSRVKALTMKDNLTYGAQRLLKLDEVPVVNDDGTLAGLFTKDVLFKALVDEMSVKTKMSKLKLTPVAKNRVTDMKLAMEDAVRMLKETEKRISIVTQDGKPGGRYIGVITI